MPRRCGPGGQRRHEERPRPLTQWLLGDQRLGMGHGFGSAAHGHVRIDPVLDGGDVPLVRRAASPRAQSSAGELDERRTSPQAEGLHEEIEPLTLLGSVGTGEKCLEPPGVEDVGGQHVPGRHAGDDIADDVAQPGHGGAYGARRSETEDVGDPIAGHDAPSTDREQRHQASLRRPEHTG